MNLPANPLEQAQQMQATAAQLGFDWRVTSELWDKLAEEVSELQAAVPEGAARIEDELGDLLFMAVNIARHLGVSPSAALAAANRKFQRRFDYILQHAHELPELGRPDRLDAMERFWQAAKRRERGQTE